MVAQGACVVALGGGCGCSVWGGGMRGCSGGACMVDLGGGHAWLLGGHAWFLPGGACMVARGGMHGI